MLDPSASMVASGQAQFPGHCMSKHDLAESYFARIRNRDLEGLLSFFSTDAVLKLPDGREFAGTDAIREMYRGLFAAQAPSPTPMAVIIGTDAIAVEIEARLPDGSVRRTANFFHLDPRDQIQRLNIYARQSQTRT
jgi:ketosteroid isomerase-like protein